MKTVSKARRTLTRRGIIGISAAVAAGLAALVEGKQAEATHGPADATGALHVNQTNPATAATSLTGAVNGGGTSGLLNLTNTAGIALAVDIQNVTGVPAIRANANASTAVQGLSTSNVGVAGTSTSNFGVNGTSTGVAGVNGSSTNSAGVAGTGSGSGGVGVVGQAASGIGVQGFSTNPNASPAISGQADAGQIGVKGSSNTGDGLQGVSNSGVGVTASSQSSVGVNASSGGSQAGVAGTSVGGPGVTANTTNGNALVGTSTNGLGLFASTAKAESTDFNNPQFFAAKIQGGDGLLVTGALRVTGQKQAYVILPDGTARQMFCTEAPEAFFEDHGVTRASGGTAHVTLDPEFAQLIETQGYFVQITALGPSAGLFVANVSEGGFDVFENGGGSTTVDFSWRVTGRRKDVQGKYSRLAKMAAPASTRSIVEAQPRVRSADELPKPDPIRFPPGVVPVGGRRDD